MPQTTKSKDKAGPEFEPKEYAFGESEPTVPVEIVIVEPEPVAKLYYPTKWKNVIDTFQCAACGHCDESRDNMILHVLTHVPASERAQLLEKLLKEK